MFTVLHLYLLQHCLRGGGTSVQRGRIGRQAPATGLQDCFCPSTVGLTVGLEGCQAAASWSRFCT